MLYFCNVGKMIGGGSLDDDEIDDDIFNVRGKDFKMTWDVLHRVKKTFFSPLSENYIDIDRSHDHFEHIIKYMEDGSLPSLSSLKNLLLMQREFEFYSFELPQADPRETIVPRVGLGIAGPPRGPTQASPFGGCV
jgi:hypothetical protein